MNFEQILQKKMQEPPSQTSSAGSSETHFAQGTDPAHLAFLIGQINRTQSVGPSKFPYKSTILPRKPHEMNSLEQDAFAFFTKHQPELSSGFTRNEIKTAFRKIALAVHPDHGGTSHEFMQLREHYKTLINIPKK